jgi:hypothetical protein
MCRDTASQSGYILDPVNSKLTIQGTSSLHEWQMEVRDFKCSMNLISTGQKFSDIKGAEFSCVPTNIVSEFKLMDKKTYEALKAEQFSSINFRMKTGEILSESGNEFSGTITGNLFIAGQTKEINIPFHGNVLEDGSVNVKGKVNLKMSQFNIDPPTAMLGTLKTGDDISIVYSFEFENPADSPQLSERKSGSGIGN